MISVISQLPFLPFPSFNIVTRDLYKVTRLRNEADNAVMNKWAYLVIQASDHCQWDCISDKPQLQKREKENSHIRI